MFESVLIANRGEIACRVIRTLKRLGIRSVAVCSEADRGALFTRLADEVVEIGPPPARESYLRADRILEAAQRTGARAIHPGYGFLSENARFAEQCAEAGVRFIGPSPSAIAAMGLKDAAKAAMERAGVPVVPGYHGADQSPSRLLEEAECIGYPVLIKAVAGGGGKGMRKVEQRADFVAALEGAQREAQGAFGDERVLLEKYLTRPRHIEVQVFADGHGNVVHLFERDCSLQRRHQKVLEEAPAPGMTSRMRARMGEAAVRAALAIGYEGAGTVEFIADVAHGLDLERFYFMEMNTRLQVEHPVTELITGLDLVEWQLRVAAGEKLPLSQEQLQIRGHALEVRLYAEDPAHEYLPQTGTLKHLALPEASPHVRVDTGVVSGDQISVYYDPMIAKLITWGDDRGAALRHLRRALSHVEVAGLTTNLALLTQVAAHPVFAQGDVHTGFLAEHAEALFAVDPERSAILRVAGIVGHLLARGQRARGAALDPWSPWNDLGAFRLHGQHTESLRFHEHAHALSAEIAHQQGGFDVILEGRVFAVRQPRLEGSQLRCSVDGVGFSAMFVEDERHAYIAALGLSTTLDFHARTSSATDEGEGEHAIKAPMPGKITALLVGLGDAVTKNAPLIRLEAMKMEHTLRARADGTIAELSVQVGEQVEAGASLLVLRPV